MRSNLDHDDYSVVEKLRAGPPTPWKWEIYRAGKKMPIERSSNFFETRGTAHLAGKAALARLMDKLND
jgi:hypothetical protein